MSIDIKSMSDTGSDISKQLVENYQSAEDKEKFLDDLDALKGSSAISNYQRDTFRSYADKNAVPNGSLSVVSNVGATKDLTEYYEKPITDRQDELHNMVQKEFDDTQTLVENEFNETQELVQREFDETQDNLNTNTNKIINNDNANHASLISDLDSNTDKIIANDNANFAVATANGDKLYDMVQKEFDDTQQLMTAKWDKIISILTVLGTSPLTEEDMAEVLAAS